MPANWRSDSFERRWRVKAPRWAVWAWLNDPRTFTRQIWPYRVEFVEGSGIGGGSGFSPGVLNAHHGPLLNASGVITEIDEGPDGEGAFRDLWYYYGSFVIGMRFVRPTRLRFWVTDENGGTEVRVRLDSQVPPWFTRIWALGNRIFWMSFPGWMRAGARKRAKSR